MCPFRSHSFRKVKDSRDHLSRAIQYIGEQTSPKIDD